VSDILLLVLSILLVIAALSDLQSYTIPNWLSLAIVGLFVVQIMVEPRSYGVIGVRLLVTACIFGLCTLLYAKRWWGGGDVKLLSSLSLWVGLEDIPRLLLTMSVVGGLLTLIVITVRWIRSHRTGSSDSRIPYGVAIAAAGLDFCLRQAHILS
jgi:prepilin peptidase CpaA